MAVPKRRTTRSKRDMRRAQHDKVTAPTLIACSHCGEAMVPHRVCAACGFYKGVQILVKKEKKPKEAAQDAPSES